MQKPLFRVNPETLLVSYNRAKKILGITSSVYNKLSSLNNRRIKNDVSAERILRDVLIPEKEVAGSGTTLKYILVPFWKTALGCNDVSEKMAIHALSLFAEAPFKSNLDQTRGLLPENLAMFIKVIVLADHQVESTSQMEISDQVGVFNALWETFPDTIKEELIGMTTVQDDNTKQLLSVILLLTQLSTLAMELQERSDFLTALSNLLNTNDMAFKTNILRVIELLLKNNVMPQPEHLTALLQRNNEFIISLFDILKLLITIEASLLYCIFPQCWENMSNQTEDIKNAVARQLCRSFSENDDSDPRIGNRIKVLHEVITLSGTKDSQTSLVCQLIRDATCKIDESEVGLAAIIDNKHKNRRIKLLSSLARMLPQQEGRMKMMIGKALKTSPAEREGTSPRTFTEKEIVEITTAIEKNLMSATYATATMRQQSNDDDKDPALHPNE